VTPAERFVRDMLMDHCEEWAWIMWHTRPERRIVDVVQASLG
jgi:hypothetical protein